MERIERVESEPIELILYVTPNSPRADAAVEKMRVVLDRSTAPKVKLTVRMLPGTDGATIESPVGVALVPVRQTGTVRTLIVGHITNPELLLELLADCDPDL